MNCSTPGFSVLHSVPKFAQTHVHWVGDAISSSVAPFSSCPLLLLPSIFLSIRVFSSKSALCIRWPKYWSFSFSICPSNEYSGLISFRISGLISLLSKGLSRVFSSTRVWKHHSSMFSLLYGPAHISIHDHWTFVGKVMSLLFNMLSRFVIAFFPRSKCLLISCLQSPSTVILEPKKIKSATVSTFLSPHLFVMKWWDQMLWS